MKLKFFHWLKIIVSVIIVTVLITNCKKDDAGSPYSQMENDILKLVNAHRDSMGLGSLTMNEVIFKQCKDHSVYMAAVDSMNHNGFTDRANNIFASFGGTSAAENVAYGYTTAQAVVTAWLNSPGHRKNIEGDYNYTGVSVVKDTKGINYFTQIFVKK